MATFIAMLGFMPVVAFIAYWNGRQSRMDEIRRLRRDNHNLKRWLENQRRATIETDLAFELERMRK